MLLPLYFPIQSLPHIRPASDATWKVESIHMPACSSCEKAEALLIHGVQSPAVCEHSCVAQDVPKYRDVCLLDPGIAGIAVYRHAAGLAQLGHCPIAGSS